MGELADRAMVSLLGSDLMAADVRGPITGLVGFLVGFHIFRGAANGTIARRIKSGNTSYNTTFLGRYVLEYADWWPGFGCDGCSAECFLWVSLSAGLRIVQLFSA